MNYRDARILRAVREAPCMMCGAQDGTVVYDLISPTPELSRAEGVGLNELLAG